MSGNEWWIQGDGSSSVRVKVQLSDEQLRSMVNLPQDYYPDAIWVDPESGRPFITFNHKSYERDPNFVGINSIKSEN